MGRGRTFSALVLASLCLLIVPSALLIGPVRAPSGTFFLYHKRTSMEIWESESVAKEHIKVTVKVTSAMADTYADSTKSSVTVQTDNYRVKVHKGETKTIEDMATDSVWLYENPGYDHNGYAYHGIEGEWTVTVLGGASDGDGNGDGGDDYGDGGGISVFLVGAIVLGIGAALIVGLLVGHSRAKARVRAPPPPPPNHKLVRKFQHLQNRIK